MGTRDCQFPMVNRQDRMIFWRLLVTQGQPRIVTLWARQALGELLANLIDEIVHSEW